MKRCSRCASSRSALNRMSSDASAYTRGWPAYSSAATRGSRRTKSAGRSRHTSRAAAGDDEEVVEQPFGGRRRRLAAANVFGQHACRLLRSAFECSTRRRRCLRGRLRAPHVDGQAGGQASRVFLEQLDPEKFGREGGRRDRQFFCVQRHFAPISQLVGGCPHQRISVRPLQRWPTDDLRDRRLNQSIAAECNRCDSI